MYSFGASREAYDRVYYKERIPVDRQIPGPGTYTLDTTLGKDSKHFSMLSRIPSECKLNNDLTCLQLTSMLLRKLLVRGPT